MQCQCSSWWQLEAKHRTSTCNISKSSTLRAKWLSNLGIIHHGFLHHQGLIDPEGSERAIDCRYYKGIRCTGACGLFSRWKIQGMHVVHTRVAAACLDSTRRVQDLTYMYLPARSLGGSTGIKSMVRSTPRTNYYSKLFVGISDVYICVPPGDGHPIRNSLHFIMIHA